jgi:hypothetical protein
MALSDEKREQVKALLATGAAKNDVAKKCKISWATVDAIAKEAPDEIENIREQKRTQFIDRLWSSMDQALGLADKRIQLALDANHKLDELTEAVVDSDLDPKKAYELQKAISDISAVPLGQISTFIGTIYDKHALMTGGKTADIGLSYEEQLKKLLGGAS